jgi:hypothetical protein
MEAMKSWVLAWNLSRISSVMSNCHILVAIAATERGNGMRTERWPEDPRCFFSQICGHGHYTF